MNYLGKINDALKNSDVRGWLFCSFRKRDPIALRLLDIPASQINTRPWYYICIKNSENIRICHSIEKDNLSTLPGKLIIYSSYDELTAILHSFSGTTLAAQFDPVLPNFSYLDYGTATRLTETGIKLVPASSLIQQVLGTLSDSQIQSHEQAARHLYDIIRLSWEKIETRFQAGDAVFEGEIRDFILQEYNKRKLISEDMPVVAAGINSGNPHYFVEGAGKQILPGEIIQFDIWAKGQADDDVFGDISWLGYTGPNPPAEYIDFFNTVRSARDNVVRTVSRALASGEKITGAECDLAAREILMAAGYGSYIKHRTGHSIDTEVHGNGVNLDSREFPDTRFLCEGSCFSVEPGLYTDRFGMRSEIDVYIRNNKAIISGGIPQQELMTFRF